MDEKWSGMGLVIFLLILFGIFGFGRGFGGFGTAYGCGMPGVYGCNATTNCQVEKQGIIDSARNQFAILDTARQTQEAAQAQFAALGTKMDFYAWQNQRDETAKLRDELSYERSKNMALENRVYSDAQFNALRAQIEALNRSVAKKPPFYAAGGNPCASIYPTGCGGTKGTLV